MRIYPLGREISSSPPLELQCQIRSKWKKLRSIVLEVKPWSLVENKSSVPLHLKDDAMKTIFDLEPGHVFSPAKLQVGKNLKSATLAYGAFIISPSPT